MWYRNSNKTNFINFRVAEDKPNDDKFVDPKIIQEIFDKIINLEKKLQENKNSIYEYTQWIAAPTEAKDLLDIFSIYSKEIDLIYKMSQDGERIPYYQNFKTMGSLSIPGQIKRIKEIHEFIKKFPMIYLQIGTSLTGEFLGGAGSKKGYSVKYKDVSPFANPFGFPNPNYKPGDKVPLGPNPLQPIKKIISNNKFIQFLEKAGPILRVMQLFQLANKSKDMIVQLKKGFDDGKNFLEAHEAIDPEDRAEFYSSLMSIPQIAALAGPFAPALLTAGFISGTVGTPIARALGDFGGTSNTSLRENMNEPTIKNNLIVSIDDLKENYGEVYNALIDSEKGMSTVQSMTKHIVDNNPYKFLLFSNFKENRDLLKKMNGKGKEFYPTASSNYVVSSFYKKNKEQTEKSKYPGPNKPIMQN